MSSNLRGDAFDVAPGRAAFGPAAWAALACGLVLLAAAGWRFAGALEERERAQISERSLRVAAQAQTDKSRRAQELQNSPAEVERSNAQRRLQEMARTSWFGLFDALESAAGVLRGSVSVTSLTPTRAGPGVTQVRMAAVATATAAMLEYVRVLRADPRILRVELASQESEGGQAEQGVVKFHLLLLWSDSISVGAQR